MNIEVPFYEEKTCTVEEDMLIEFDSRVINVYPAVGCAIGATGGTIGRTTTLVFYGDALSDNSCIIEFGQNISSKGSITLESGFTSIVLVEFMCIGYGIWVECFRSTATI